MVVRRGWIMMIIARGNRLCTCCRRVCSGCYRQVGRCDGCEDGREPNVVFDRKQDFLVASFDWEVLTGCVIYWEVLTGKF